MRGSRNLLVGTGVAAIVLALALALVGCGGGGSATEDAQKNEDTSVEQTEDGSKNADSDVEEPVETGAWVLKATRTETTWSYDDETHTSVNNTTYELDEQGNVLTSTQESIYDDQESSPYVEAFTYDEQGFVLTRRIVEDYVKLYGESAAPLREEFDTKFPTTKYEYELDDEGRPTKRSALKRVGELNYTTIYSYDEDGNPAVEEISVNEDAVDPTYEDAGYYTTYTYNSKGDIDSISAYQKNENMTSSYYEDGKEHTEIYTSTVLFDEQGFPTSSESVTEHDDGTKETSDPERIWEMDDTGKPTKLTTISSDGSESVRTFTYDENNNLSSEIYDSEDSSYHSELHFEWTYIEEPSLAVRLATHLFERGSLNN